MTREEAIKCIQEEKLRYERAPLVNGCPMWEEWQKAIDICDMALSALRAQQEQESNEPLTLDELRRMDGEPVWIVEEPDWGHWELSADAEDYLADRDECFYGMKHDDPDGRYGLHKLGWLAYRHQLKNTTEG